MSSPAFRSYAQNFEDILLWRALRHVPRGCYIDIGAHEPRAGSVSRGFYELGWRGVHFEPHPAVAERIRLDRPDEVVHEAAVSDTTGILRFSVNRNSGLSTGVAEYADAYRRSGEVVEDRDVVATTLAKACAPLVGRDVHWMKIDVEGMEERVLRGWDPQTLRPWIVLVEATRPNTTEPSHDAWEPLLLDAGYRFVLYDGLNRFYVAAERPELIPPFSAPANVHDLVAGCELDASSPFVTAPLSRQNRIIAVMRSSWSWRVTQPLRWLHALILGGGELDDA